MTKLIKELIRRLKSLPEEEQERYAALFLRDLRRRKQQRDGEQEGQEAEELYEPFRIMLDADLDLPSGYSETYEQHLYGGKEGNE